MTGFSKRKKAREAAVRNKAIEREREEKNEARRGVSSLTSMYFGIVGSAEAMEHHEVDVSGHAPLWLLNLSSVLNVLARPSSSLASKW